MLEVSKEPLINSPVAIITGAAQGIGRRTAELFALRHYRLALLDIADCSPVLQAIELSDSSAMALRGSVTDESFITQSFAEVLRRFGRVDVLVNNAGISLIKPAAQTSADEWRRVLDINLTGPFLLCQAAGQIMLAQRSGSIINVASVAGLAAIAERSAYNASKHGLIGLTRTLAAEWGAYGVRVNAVCPGCVKTEMDSADQGSGAYTDDDIEGRIPMARFASPDDIANAIAFLADSSQSGFINGHSLSVDGGWIADASWESLRRKQRPSR